MKKFIAFYCFLSFAGCAQLATAQSKGNKHITETGASIAPRFIDGISFNPDGISKNTESVEEKSIKAEGVVPKKNIIEYAVEKSNSIIEKLTALQFKYAMLLNVDVESLKNLSLFGLIDTWFGTKYRMGGTTKSGIDCSAFTDTIFSAVYGCQLPRTAREQYQATTHIPQNNLKEGDLVFFKMHGGVSHVGFYLANNYFVHASTSQGVTISSLDDSYYAKKFICGGRLFAD